MSALLSIEDFRLEFATFDGVAKVLDGINLAVAAQETVGIVGETGCGKSITAKSVLRLVPSPPAHVRSGAIRFKGEDLLTYSEPEMRRVRGNEIAMIFQDPMSYLNPLFTVGQQLSDVIRAHAKVSGTPLDRAAVRARALELFRQVRLPHPEHQLGVYPHQLSGGMRQRIMIAMALVGRPALLIADEPTTALDVTIQAQILQLIKDIQAETGMGLIMITHDLGVIAETVDRVVVMYGGKVMETGPVQQIFSAPLHPYTRALLNSIPGQVAGKRRLTEIPGSSPNPVRPPGGCPFHPRCPMAIAACHQVTPPLETKVPGREAACIRVESELVPA